MITLHPEYTEDKAVKLTVAEWEQIVEELEELDDIRVFDEAKSRNEESISFDQAVKEIQGC